MLNIGSAEQKAEALWIISNIAANGEDESLIIINNGPLANMIYAVKDRNKNIKREAVWGLGNLCQRVN